MGNRLISLYLLKFSIVTWLLVYGLTGIVSAQTARSAPPQSEVVQSGLKGYVMSPDSVAIPNSVVSLFRLDSSLVKTRQADSSGLFEFNQVPFGAFLLRATRLGYNPVNQPIVVRDTLAVTWVNITLEPSVNKLNEVLVKEKRLPFEVLSDRIIINVASNPVYSGGNALEALASAPRLSVDPITKSVSIDGKSGVILYQNDSQVNLPSDQVIGYLQTLQASAISRIEVLTNPPARYDAGSSGIILIYTKGIRKDGVNGEASLSVGAGRYFKSNGSLNLALRSARLQGTILYTPGFRPTYYSWKSDQILTASTVSQAGFSHSDQFNQIDNLSHTLRTGWDLTLSKSLTLGTVLLGSQMSDTDNPTSTLNFRLPQENALKTQIDARTQNQRRIANFAANIHLRKQFKDGKALLSTDVDYAHHVDNAKATSAFTQLFPKPLPTESVQIRYPSAINIGTAKIDFSTNFTKAWAFEAGLKYSTIRMQNSPAIDQFSAGFAPLISLLATSYRYHEKTRSAYESMRFTWLNWAVVAGLRLEHTNYEGVSGVSSVIRRTYTNLFPTFSLQYRSKTEYQSSFSVNRRIIRPGFDQLNPAYVFYDPLTLYSGNPLLLPQLTTTWQLFASTPKQTSLTILYSYTRNRIAEIVYRYDSLQATTLDRNINFDWERRFAATLSWPLRLSTAWQLQATLTGAYSQFYGTFADRPTQTSQTTATVRLNNTFKVRKWDANLNITYRSLALIGYMYYDPIAFVDLGLQRSLTKRSTLKLAATDIFHSMLIQNYGDYLNTHIIFRHRYESQRIMLTFSAQFGNTKAKRVKEGTFGSDSEQERLGGSSSR
jgi:iron complex outermembrane receptor protein